MFRELATLGVLAVTMLDSGFLAGAVSRAVASQPGHDGRGEAEPAEAHRQ